MNCLIVGIDICRWTWGPYRTIVLRTLEICSGWLDVLVRPAVLDIVFNEVCVVLVGVEELWLVIRVGIGPIYLYLWPRNPCRKTG